MSPVTPSELVNRVLKIVSRQDWRDAPRALDELRNYLLGNPFDFQFEFFGVPSDAILVGESITAEGRELIVSTSSLPYKAVLVLGSRDQWKLKQFLTQCTGCLGTGHILDKFCGSCSGTGWGLRPS